MQNLDVGFSIEDYTDEELFEMDEARINNLVAIEFAYAGVKPMQEPTEPVDPVKDGPKSAIAYKVKRSYHDSLTFKNNSDAELVAKMPMMHANSAYEHNIQWLIDNTDEVTIETLIGKTAEEKDAVKEAAAEYKQAKEIYDKQLSAWKDYRKVEQELREKISTRRCAERDRRSNIADNNYEWKRLLALANNDEAIARRFFYNAFRFDDVALAQILGEVTDEDKAIAPPEPEKQEDDLPI